MKKTNVRKLALAGLLVAVGVVCSSFNIPVEISRYFPVQHMVNVLAAVFLGPWYGLAMAFTYAGEMFGTGIIGRILAYPVAVLFMAKDVAVFAFVIPFLISTVGGTIIASAFVTALKKTKALNSLLSTVE